MKTFKNFLTEGKQVGTLYHYTRLDNLFSILSDDYMKGHGDTERISFTRDSKFHARYVAGNICSDARITIDGNKLSTKYKIAPFHDLDWFKKRSAQDSDDEMEEVVKAKRITNITKYIKEIKIMFNSGSIKLRNHHEHWAELIGKIKAQCDKYNIPLYTLEGEEI